MKTAWLLETEVSGRIAYFKGKHGHGSGPEYTFDANSSTVGHDQA